MENVSIATSLKYFFFPGSEKFSSSPQHSLHLISTHK